MAFEVYIALGDSMTIDDYPAGDAERLGLNCRKDIGAAALLYKNDDRVFQGFANFNAAVEVKRFREVFDYVWQYGEAEPELQVLHI